MSYNQHLPQPDTKEYEEAYRQPIEEYQKALINYPKILAKANLKRKIWWWVAFILVNWVAISIAWTGYD